MGLGPTADSCPNNFVVGPNDNNHFEIIRAGFQPTENNMGLGGFGTQLLKVASS